MEEENPIITENLIKKPLFYYDYLSDESCDNIKKILDNNFFTNKINESLIHFKPIRFQTKNFIELPPLKNLKQKIMNEKKSNKKISKNHLNSKSLNDIGSNEFINLILNSKLQNRKIQLPKLKKNPPKDKFPIKYKSNYIDQVEKNFIKPYLNKDNIIYDDFLENKRSRIPFNFIINK